MDADLARLVLQGRITKEAAAEAALNPPDELADRLTSTRRA